MKMQTAQRRNGTGRTVAAALLSAAAIFLLPLAIFGGTGTAAGKTAEAVLPPSPSPVQTGDGEGGGTSVREQFTGEDAGRMVRIQMEDGQIVEQTMAEYLWCVVAAEMPASFEPDALMAQATAARTYTLWKALHNKAHPQANVCTDYTCCQAWISREEALERWGAQGPEYTEKLDKALRETDGVVLYYDSMPIQAVFHASSAGSTQDAVAVWGSTVPYLSAVATPEGEEAPNYHTTVTMTEAQVRAALEAQGCELEELKPEEWLKELSYSDSGALLSAQVGGVTLRGNELRTALGLRSPSFTVEYGGDGFTFHVTGYGHGVGLSQYGANALAKQGKTWREIVSWYYTGVEFGTYDGVTPAGQAGQAGTAGG